MKYRTRGFDGIEKDGLTVRCGSLRVTTGSYKNQISAAR
jgi:hypothetical protein